MTKLSAYFATMLNEAKMKTIFFQLLQIEGVTRVVPDLGQRTMTICTKASALKQLKQAFPTVDFVQQRAIS